MTQTNTLINSINSLKQQEKDIRKDMLAFIRNYVYQHGCTIADTDDAEYPKGKTYFNFGKESVYIDYNETLVHSEYGVLNEYNDNTESVYSSLINQYKVMEIMDSDNGHDEELVRKINALYAKYPNTINKLLSALFVSCRDEAMDINLTDTQDEDFAFEMLEHICNNNDLQWIIDSVKRIIPKALEM